VKWIASLMDFASLCLSNCAFWLSATTKYPWWPDIVSYTYAMDNYGPFLFVLVLYKDHTLYVGRPRGSFFIYTMDTHVKRCREYQHHCRFRPPLQALGLLYCPIRPRNLQYLRASNPRISTLLSYTFTTSVNERSFVVMFIVQCAYALLLCTVDTIVGRYVDHQHHCRFSASLQAWIDFC
jgi:hypothetical protein